MANFRPNARQRIDLRDRQQNSPPIKLAEYQRYVDAQAAVDRLSDQGLRMSDVSIVWSGLRRVEYVTGRRTVATAARDGALKGAWFALVLGLLFTAFAEVDTALVSVLAVYALTGAIVVGAYQAFTHWAQQGARDFSTVSDIDAERFDVWVEPGSHAQAQSILGISSTRPNDPSVAETNAP